MFYGRSRGRVGMSAAASTAAAAISSIHKYIRHQTLSCWMFVRVVSVGLSNVLCVCA